MSEEMRKKIREAWEAFREHKRLQTPEEPLKVLESLVRIFTPTGSMQEMALTCVSNYGCPDSPDGSRPRPFHQVTPGTLNGEPGWMECACLTCGEATVWHVQTNTSTQRYRKGMVLSTAYTKQ